MPEPSILVAHRGFAGKFLENTLEALNATYHVDKKLAPRVVTIYGGKLTAYRVTSEKFVAKFYKLMPKRTCKARTSNLQLSPDPQ